MIRKKLRQIWAKIHKYDDFATDYKDLAGTAEIPAVAFTNWGRYLSDIKDYDSAIEKLETALSINPTNAEAYSNLGILYAKKRDYKKAEEYIEKSLKIDPLNRFNNGLLCGIYTELGKNNEAENLINRAKENGTDYLELYVNYAIALAKQKKYHKAIQQVKHCRDVEPTNVNCRYLLALFYLDSGSPDEAYPELRYIKQMKDDYPQIDYHLGYCLAKMKDYKGAYNYALKELERDKNNPSLYILLAECASKLGNTEAAKTFYNESIKQGFENDMLYYSWGNTLFAAGQTEDAKEKYLKVLHKNPEHLKTIHKLAQCFLRTKDYKTAEEFCLKALKIKEDYEEAFADLGFIMYRQNKFEDALGYFEKASKASQKYNFLSFYIANCLAKIGKEQESIEYYIKTIEDYPNHLEAYIRYIEILLKFNDTKEALRKVRAAYKINRNNTKILWLYAITLYKTGLYFEAGEKTDEILAIQKENIDAKYLKADALIKINKANEAIQILNEMPESQKETEIFNYLSFLAYSNLKETETESYNNDTTLYYYDKMKKLLPNEEAWEEMKHYLTKKITKEG